MSNITTLPNNMSYYAAQDKKSDGMPVLVLNLAQTYIEAVPERLRGVDRVVAKKGQLKFVAPDYQGEIVVTTPGKVWERRSLTVAEISILKARFNDRNQMARGIFEQSYKASERGAGYPEEEMHLPAGLKFSWNKTTRKGALDAQKTLLEKTTEMANVATIKLATPKVIQERLARQEKFKKQCADKNNRRDFYKIAKATHNIAVHY